MNTAVASLLLSGASLVAADWGFSATGLGSAHVVNQCSYPVKLCNVPSAGGGHEQQDTELAPGGSWQQSWTSLSNGNGWSIKLSRTDNLDHILQYEYTFHDDGIIWYDLSCVNGNPWDHDWEITATGSDCSPKQRAYRYSTDDAYGMQSCSQNSDITVTLCTGTSADNGTTAGGSSGGSSSNPASSPPAYSAPASSPTPPSYHAPASSSPAATPPSYNAPASSASAATPPSYNPPTPMSVPNFPHPLGYNEFRPASSSPVPTTFATSTTAADDGIVYVTEVETIYKTAGVTAYAYGKPNRRRHEHPHAHAHRD